MNKINDFQKIVADRVYRVQFQFLQQLPSRQRTVDCDSFGSDEEISKTANSFDFVFQGLQMMEILFFVEFLELVVKSLSLSSIALPWEIANVFLGDVVFEFLEHSQLREPDFQPLGFAGNKLG